MAEFLPNFFVFAMGLAILLYVMLDGFDLGIGILFAGRRRPEKDIMIAAIGPFWDANETWMVLGVGMLLIAFPAAHGVILTALYIPVTLLLIGLILRGVAFDFRAKVPTRHKTRWNRLFLTGSLIASLAQGYMLGVYVLGLGASFGAMAFGALVALCLAAAYAAMGAAWLIYKTEGELQQKAVRWLRAALVLTALGMAAVSLATPFASPRIFDRWFVFPEMIYLAPLPILSAVLFASLWWQTFHLPKPGRPPCDAAVPDAGADLRARLRRARLVVLSVRGAGSPDHLAGGERAGKPRRHPDRHRLRAADHHLRLGLRLPGVRRQGDRAQLRLRSATDLIEN